MNKSTNIKDTVINMDKIQYGDGKKNRYYVRDDKEEENMGVKNLVEEDRIGKESIVTTNPKP
ncbi:hypothetical protein FRX31_009691 [Thalictrum thalictroides]|uniref:Uncharacterized protein n=1 Tax=Thalictrum thalictroides TaxID=46969 RepID=A0A7J6WTL8_THATH|nr:hypothetical protein FRX31_009691 [Thalictrum thalictroides]